MKKLIFPALAFLVTIPALADCGPMQYEELKDMKKDEIVEELCSSVSQNLDFVLATGGRGDADKTICSANIALMERYLKRVHNMNLPAERPFVCKGKLKINGKPF